MAMPSPLHIAIVGGGLCGLSLALALKHRNIAFTIYEARSSFSEIGAGINLGPNGLRALRLIDPSVGEEVYSLATRNLPPEEDTWMWFRYGAPSGDHEDGEIAFKVSAPQTGSMTLHRQELLAALAGRVEEGNAKFMKRFVDYKQDDQGVTLHFEDGTQERASVLVACDGIHSRVRTTMFGNDNPVSKPHFNHDGAYRIVIPMEKAVQAWGESGRQSQVLFGPNGYIITYPINKGAALNCGVWIERPEDWDHESWVIPEQGFQLQIDLKDWGPRVHRLMEHFDPNPAFWAAHQHSLQPNSFVDDRVILIGDAAHSMPPHQGAGASQAVEDAYVLASVLGCLAGEEPPFSQSLNGCLRAADEMRRPRFEMVKRLSAESGLLFFGFLRRKLEGHKREQWFDRLKQRLGLIWGGDVAEDAQKARLRMHGLYSEIKINDD